MDGKKTQLVTVNIYSNFIKFLYNTQNCLKDMKLNPLRFTQKNFLNIFFGWLILYSVFLFSSSSTKKLWNAYTRT